MAIDVIESIASKVICRTYHMNYIMLVNATITGLIPPCEVGNQPEHDQFFGGNTK